MAVLCIAHLGLSSLQDYQLPPLDRGDIIALYCHNNNLSDLVGCPPTVKELYCGNNALISLRGCPSTLEKLHCQGNRLTSLEYCPSTVKILQCNYNQITSLVGCPPTVKELYCHHNQITSLVGCPPTVTNLTCNDNPLDCQYANKTLEQIHALNREKKVTSFTERVVAKKIQRAWKRYWYTPNKEGEAPCAKRSYQRDVMRVVMKKQRR